LSTADETNHYLSALSTRHDLCFTWTAEVMMHVEHRSTMELIADLIGLKRGDAGKQAARVLRAFKSLDGILRAGHGGLVATGLSSSQANAVMAGLELGRRATLQPYDAGRPILDPASAYAAVADMLSGLVRERFVAIALDAKNRPKARYHVAEGCSDACPVDPREVFAPAIVVGASGLLVAHNHPSGDLEPSEQDRVITGQLACLAAMLRLPLIDHIIVGRNDYCSMVALGHLKPTTDSPLGWFPFDHASVQSPRSAA
jgi:DNA repair protein RadC